MKFKQMVRNPRVIFMLVLLLLAAVVFLINPESKRGTFRIEDKCGKFVNLMSHTIENEDACKTRCRSQCDSARMRFKKVQFEKSELGCNSCTCRCS